MLTKVFLKPPVLVFITRKLTHRDLSLLRKAPTHTTSWFYCFQLSMGYHFMISTDIKYLCHGLYLHWLFQYWWFTVKLFANHMYQVSQQTHDLVKLYSVLPWSFLFILWRTQFLHFCLLFLKQLWLGNRAIIKHIYHDGNDDSMCQLYTIAKLIFVDQRTCCITVFKFHCFAH